MQMTGEQRALYEVGMTVQMLHRKHKARDTQEALMVVQIVHIVWIHTTYTSARVIMIMRPTLHRHREGKGPLQA